MYFANLKFEFNMKKLLAIFGLVTMINLMAQDKAGN